MSQPDPHAMPVDESVKADPIEFDALCETCGYNLRGLTQLRCPECGTGFSVATLYPATAPWGPLLWESEGTPSYFRRFRLTWFGLIVHPLDSMRQLGTTPRLLGRRSLSLVLWLCVLSVLLALVTLAGNAYARHLIQQRGYSVIPFTTFELWLREQLSWWDSMITGVFDTVMVLGLLAVLQLLNHRRDPYRELALFCVIGGLILVAWQLGPSPLAGVVAIVAAAVVAVILAVFVDWGTWPRIVSQGTRNIIYFTAIGVGFDLYLWIIHSTAHLLSVLYGDPLKTHVLLERASSYSSTMVLTMLLYWFLRRAFGVHPLRAVGLAVLYAALRQLCLDGITETENPLGLMGVYLDWIPMI